METNSVEVKRNFPKEYRATVDKWLTKDNKPDDGCICKGNWRLIVNEYLHLLDKQFRYEYDGKTYTFFGIVYASDDYYYGMADEDNKILLASCVGSLETDGFVEISDTNRDKFTRDDSQWFGQNAKEPNGWINIEEAKPEIPDKRHGIVVDVAWFDKWYEEANPGHGWEVGTAIWNGKEFLDLFTGMGDVCAEYLPTCNHIRYWQYRPKPPQVKCKE